MTVLNYSDAVNFPRQEVWRFVADFAKSPQYLNWLDKAEPLNGSPQGPGGIWRFHVITSAGLCPLDVEITEWLEGERFALMPVENSGIFKNIQLFQIVIDLKEKPSNYTQIKVHCEYKPVGKRGRLKNLAFLRRRFLDMIAQSVNTLSHVAAAEAWKRASQEQKIMSRKEKTTKH